MIGKRSFSSPTELWYPYGEPGVAHVHQGIEDNQDSLADSKDYSRPAEGLLTLGS